jgi:hypothetical protein
MICLDELIKAWKEFFLPSLVSSDHVTSILLLNDFLLFSPLQFLWLEEQ